MIVVSAKVIARICPQMSQMFTDEEKHLWMKFSHLGHGESWSER